MMLTYQAAHDDRWTSVPLVQAGKDEGLMHLWLVNIQFGGSNWIFL